MSTSFTQTWLFMESFLSSYLSSSILQSTDRLTKPVIDSWTCIYLCSIIHICNIISKYFRKLVRHFQYSILFDQLFRSAKSVDLCQGTPSIRERSDLHKLAVELLQVITTTTTTSSDQQWWFLTNHQVMNSFVLRMKCSYLNNTESINEVVVFSSF